MRLVKRCVLSKLGFPENAMQAAWRVEVFSVSRQAVERHGLMGTKALGLGFRVPSMVAATEKPAKSNMYFARARRNCLQVPCSSVKQPEAPPFGVCRLSPARQEVQETQRNATTHFTLLRCMPMPMSSPHIQQQQPKPVGSSHQAVEEKGAQYMGGCQY